MKLALAVLFYLVMAGVLCAGIVMMVGGRPWLLIAAFLLYAVAFAKIGCLGQH